MVNFSENDKKLWLSIWPWGFIWTLVVMIFIAISEYLVKENLAQYGKLFYALLIVPFAWHGYDWYAKFLFQRSINKHFIRFLTTAYLVTISGSLVFIREKEFDLQIISVLSAQLALTVYLWRRHFDGICDCMQSNLFDISDFSGRYFYDIALFVFPVALAFMF